MKAVQSFLWGCLLLVISVGGHAQSDTSFWFAAPAVTPGHSDTPIVVRLSSYAQAADIIISQPANPSFQPYHIHLNPYAATTVDLTGQLEIIENKPANTVLNYGIRISATAKISAYYEVEGKRGTTYYNPEIFSLKGAISKGLQFMIPGQTRFPNGSYTPQPRNGFVIVATEDNTSVDISLTNPDMAGHSPGQLFTIVLNKGQTYAVVAAGIAGNLHLAGSSVKATKPVCVTIYDDSIGPLTGCRDLVGDQLIPENSNGKEFIIVRGMLTVDGTVGDYYYILATTDGTTITINGTIAATINRGQIYEGLLTDPSAYIVTSNPVYLYQLTGTGCEMATANLPSIKCTGSQLVTFVRSASTPFYLNILCRNTETGSFLLNGQAGIITASLFNAVPSTNGQWMAARISGANLGNIDNLITPGVPTVVSNTSGLFHLGFLNGASGSVFGYFSNYGNINISPVVNSTQCVGSDIQLSSTLISNTTYQWKGPNNFTSNQYNPVISNPTAVNSGTYYVTASQQACGNFTDSITVTVHPVPTVTLKGSDTICYGASKMLTLQLTGSPPWSLLYSDGTGTDTLTHITASPYTFPVTPGVTTRYVIKNVTDTNACMMNKGGNPADTVVTVAVRPQPKAGFTATPDTVCQDGAIAFKGLGNGSGGAAVKWVWDLANGTVAAERNPWKQFKDSGRFAIRYYFFNAQGCSSDTVSKDVMVFPNPHLVLDPSISVLEGETVMLKPRFYYGQSLHFQWMPATYLSSDTVVSPQLMPTGNITYTLKLTGSGGCSVSDTVFIRLLKRLEVPNAFSPNGDGINDTWQIRYLDTYPGVMVQVFNRYGQIVFSSTGYAIPWDGTMNGKPLPIGTYYYIINPKSGRQVISGSVTILR
ncbi:MAG: gliding motility-associated C-terminal domain-containing protein [Sediminibacterium magnilacihabitans]|jgi:gliding motility-associated-like protein|nr:gliding motility-associated C-terminal domain-containing protein [Sediminibacterium magnilacihabitans]PQV59540.1 gliding motility-associated-like protein [Sediminibacterium magnilacihabitans]